MSEFHDIFLTGIGAITARGDYTLREQKPRENNDFSIADFDLKNYPLSPKTYLDRCSALALAGCALALHDAQISPPLNSDDSDMSTHNASAHNLCGITLGTHLGCLETMKTFWDKAIEKGARLANPLLFSHSYLNSPISLCAIEFGLKGYHATFCSGESSGLDAVRAAFDALRLGHAGLMVCGGAEAVSPARALFEPAENMGEASVFFVLETREHAQARDADLQHEISESWFEFAPDVSTQVMQQFGACGGATSALQLLQFIRINSS
jgi:3-oxoacyl-(acyl-carrier-protein) synthase